ncbi:hypothetical protein RWA02_02660 [Sinorhizobium meliloti]|uniref:hypothetical protein n=1 Tax=Rhizobium meliloti TaxID=382 RepID=UPI00299D188F
MNPAHGDTATLHSPIKTLALSAVGVWGRVVVVGRIVLGAVASFLWLSAAHADIIVERIEIQNAPPVLLLKGQFTQSDDPQALAREAAASGAKIVTFDSGGGNVVSAIAYGRLIRSLGLSTFQLRSGECASACALAFVGGAMRQAEPGAIGVHQSSFSPESTIGSHEAVAAVQAMTAEIMNYLIEMDVDPKLLQLSLSISSDDMRYLTASEMRQYRVTAGSPGELPASAEVNKTQPPVIPETSRAPASESKTTPPVAQSNEQKALEFLTAYHDAWSRENSTALRFMETAYGSAVEFYGKTVTKADVIEEKRAFALRWPVRVYNVKPNSERVSCSNTCRVDGVVDWYAKRAAGDRASSGSAEFSLMWDPATSKIVSETGKVIETDKGASQPIRLISQWYQDNSTCRGSIGDSPERTAACSRREALTPKLEAVGWCYGREGEYGYQMDWHVCGTPATPSTDVATTMKAINAPKARDYPSQGRMIGKTILPDFKGRDREFNTFRTRIRNGMSEGPNFAGHFSVIQIGCGTGCSGVIVGDNKTGRPSRFPRGGEANMYLDLAYQLNSRLLAAQWLDYDTDRCFIEFFDYDRTSWKVLSKFDIGTTEACYRDIQDNLQ